MEKSTLDHPLNDPARPVAEKEPGIFSPYPPCCSIPACKSCGEENTFCYKVGGCGVSETPFGVPRHKWMFIAFCINLVALIFLIAGAFGISEKESILRDVYWSKIKVDNYGTFYIGPQAVITRWSNDSLGFSDGVTSWDDIDCSEGFFSNDCNNCADAAESTTSTAILGIITTIPSIMTNVQRSTRAGDLNCQKFMALFTGLLGGLSTLSTLATYADNCWNISSGETSHMGPGFVLQMFGTILKFFDIFFHAFLQTPPYKRGQTEEKDIEASHSVNM